MQTTQHHKKIVHGHPQLGEKERHAFWSLPRQLRLGLELLIDWALNCATDGTNNGITLQTVISDLDFADDICLLEDNAAYAQSLQKKTVDGAKEVGLFVNASRTKCTFDLTDPVVLFLDSLPLENVTEFVYLGSRIPSDGKIATEKWNKIARATANSSRLAKLGKNKETTRNTKNKV